MKKRVYAVALAATMFALTGCGLVATTGNSTAKIIEENAAKAATPEDNTEKNDEFIRRDGYTIKYNPKEFAYNDGNDSISFVYQGECAGTSALTVKYVKDTYPDEAITALTDTWGDPDMIKRWEGFFPGTTDKWGYFRSMKLPGNPCVEETAIAGEYNGGALLFEISVTLSEDEESQGDENVKKALNDLLDTITYDNFETQTMYSYIPGKYKMQVSDEIEGELTEAEYSVTLNSDHTGVISFQDDVKVIWGSYQLTAEDGSFIYEFNVAGDTLMVNYDGNWLTFDEKE